MLVLDGLHRGGHGGFAAFLVANIDGIASPLGVNFREYLLSLLLGFFDIVD